MKTTHLAAVQAYAEKNTHRSWPFVPRSKPKSPVWMTTKKDIFLEDMGMHEPGLNRVIRAGYTLLGLQNHFTAGVKEVRA